MADPAKKYYVRKGFIYSKNHNSGVESIILAIKNENEWDITFDSQLYAVTGIMVQSNGIFFSENMTY